MNKLCHILSLNEEELFNKITKSFKEKITQWDYFVNWKKVFENIKPIEKELNLLNYLIGKEDFENEAFNLIKQYPQVIKAFPTLIAIREKSIDVLIETKHFIYKKYSFNNKTISDLECKELTEFFMKSGIGEMIKYENVKSLVDYATGVEVGLDSNGRKNRGGTLMENLVHELVVETCEKLNLLYMPQATSSKIKSRWNIDVEVDKSKRILDFAVNNKGKVYFIECNFYGGGGSKLKSTATEYIEMNKYWNKQGIEFIWVTDGAGWKSTLKPLREYFDKADYLVNLELLKDGILEKIIKY